MQGFLGAGAHTDWGVLTLLATCSEPGLQVHSSPRYTCHTGTCFLLEIPAAREGLYNLIIYPNFRPLNPKSVARHGPADEVGPCDALAGSGEAPDVRVPSVTCQVPTGSPGSRR